MILRVDNRVRIARLELREDLAKELQKQFTHKNPKHAMNERMGLPTWKEPREIKTWREDGPDLTFPRGGLARVREVLEEAHASFDQEDEREDQPCDEVPDVCFTPRDYQHAGADVIIAKEQALIRAPTASGKTSILLAAIARAKQWTLVVCPSVKILQQWQGELGIKLGVPAKEVGIVRGGVCKIRPITLGIWKSVEQRAERDPAFVRSFGFVAMDEVHLAGAKSFFGSIDPFPARYRVGVSNDHRRKDRKEFLVTDLFGPPVVEIPRDMLVEQGHILDVETRVVPTDFAAPWYGLPSERVVEDEVTGEKRTVRTDETIDTNRLHKEMAADADRNWLALRYILEEARAGKQVLVFAHEREHCRTLAQLVQAQRVRVGMLIGGDDFSAEWDRTLSGLHSGKISVGVGTYKALSTGIDIPSAFAGVAVTPLAANEQLFGQVRGRFCRTSTGKAGARLYVLWDRSIFPAHLANMRRWNPKTVVRDETVLSGWEEARQWMKDDRKRRRLDGTT